MYNYYGPSTRPTVTELSNGQTLIKFENGTGIIARLILPVLRAGEKNVLFDVWVIPKMDVKSGEFTFVAFGSIKVLALFNRLRALQGVGVSKASDIIMKSDPADVEASFLFDPVSLLKLKGLPPKARQELEAELPKGAAGKPTTAAVVDSEAVRGAIGALTTLGFTKALAREKVLAALAKQPFAAEELLVKMSLKY